MSYSKFGCTGYAFEVAGLILKCGFAPHVVGVSALMNALYQQLRINEVALLFHKMKNHLGYALNIVTYTNSIKGLWATSNSRKVLQSHQQIVFGLLFLVLSADL